MPLRKNGPIVTTAIAAAAVFAFATPTTANAGIFTFLAPNVTATPKPSPTPSPKPSATAPTPAPVAASPAATSSAVPAGAGCTQLPTTKAFAGVDGDNADYSLAPGGGFEDGTAGWTFANGAKIVPGNETLGISAGSHALQLPLGASATPPRSASTTATPASGLRTRSTTHP